MTPDEYLLRVLSGHQASISSSQAQDVRQRLTPVIHDWADGYLLGVSLSGSYAKNTGLKGSTDLDLFISLDSSTPFTLKDIYDRLYSKLNSLALSPRMQDVSIGINYAGLSIDLTPGKKQPGNTTDHSLFSNRTQTWMQTNVQQHIDLVRNSGRVGEIKATKIWRNINNLNFPSFLLELTVLEALSGENRNQLATNFLTVLDYLRDHFPDSRIIDPANSNNIVSDDINSIEKVAISNRARDCRWKPNWGQIIW